MPERRVVFDTGVLVSACIRPDSVSPLALHRAWLHFAVCDSNETLAELTEVLGRRKFDAYLPIRLRRQFALGFAARVRLVLRK
jgi:predicted nucleic acid-binding protein